MTAHHHTPIINATIQLQKEFDHICFQYRIKLNRPTILIENLSDSFGKWDCNRNIIFISESLIFKYKWDVVISVLKHEMAHQIVSQIYKSNHAHGPDFIKAAQSLGLDPFYTKANISIEQDIPDFKQTHHSNDEIAIFRKVEKLLSLTESSNENESLLAMEKVRELYKKYNIDKFAHNTQTNYVSCTIDLKLKKIPSHVFVISDILQKHFFVSTVFAKLYVPLENCEHRCFVIMGEKHNVLMAEHIYEFLLQKIESLWKIYQKSEKLPAKFKSSYQKGLLAGFQTKLDVLKGTSFSDSHKNETAIIKKYEIKLAEYVKTQFPKTSSIQQGGLLYKDHYDKGAKEGRFINLSRPISERSSLSQKFLGAK